MYRLPFGIVKFSITGARTESPLNFVGREPHHFHQTGRRGEQNRKEETMRREGHEKNKLSSHIAVCLLHLRGG